MPRHTRVTDPNKVRTRVGRFPVTTVKIPKALGKPDLRCTEIVKVNEDGVATEIVVHNRPVR